MDGNGYTPDEWQAERKRAFEETITALNNDATLPSNRNKVLPLMPDDTLLCIDGYPVGRFGDLPVWARGYIQYLHDKLEGRVK